MNDGELKKREWKYGYLWTLQSIIPLLWVVVVVGVAVANASSTPET